MRRLIPFVSVVALVACVGGSEPVGSSSAPLSSSEAAVRDALERLGANDVVIDNVQEYGRGAIVAQFSHRIDGIEVFNGGGAIILDRAHKPLTVTGSLIATKPTQPLFTLDGKTAIASALVRMTGLAASTTSARPQPIGEYTWFDVALDASTLVHMARARRVWFEGQAAYYVELDVGRATETTSDMRSFIVSAKTGEVLMEHDLIAHDAFSYRVWAESTGSLAPWAGPQGPMLTPHPTGTLDTTIVAPKAPVLVTLANAPFSKNDPWLPADATETEGNNVNAYADLGGSDGFDTEDIRPNTTGPLAFDRIYDTSKAPNGNPDQIKAATTQLFYLGNFMHDWFYDAGFNEAARNHQFDNLGRGGNPKDPLRMEAQDFSGRNNADAATPADGASARIQMYLFNGVGKSSLTVTSDSSTLGVRSAPFGPSNFDVTAEVVLVDDGGGTTSDGCEKPFVNAAAVKGKIALIDRGVCAFTDKVLNAEAAGAAGVLIANNVTGSPPYLGGTAGVVVKTPVLSISQSDGAKLRAATTTVRMFRETALDRDGGIDATISAHEWGHTLSNRLIGNGNGLLNQQGGGMGEGWSDFIALLTTVHTSDTAAAEASNWTGTYAMGPWTNGSTAAGAYFGIRRYPYSADMTKNPLTFKHIQNGTKLPSDVPLAYGESGNNNSEVHATGEVWSAMLWQCYVNILRDKRNDYAENSKRMRTYLVAGMKATPVSPTIIEARDALLVAMYAADQADFKACAKGFAERGAGVGAIAPDRASRTQVGVTESFNVGNDLEVVSVNVAETKSCDEDGTLDNGESGTVTLKVRNIGTDTISAATGKLSSKSGNFTFVNDGKVTFPALKPFESAEVSVEVSLNGAAPNSAQDIDVAINAEGLVVPRTIAAKLPLIVDSDVLPDSAVIDTVDIDGGKWTTSTAKTSWARVRDPMKGTNWYWSIIGNPDRSDRSLTSPPLEVSADKPLVISFEHRYTFEVSRGLNWDGGVFEISTDDGKTWEDAGTSAYNGTLTTTNNDNPLKGRKAFVGKSAGYPAFAKVSIDLGTTYAGKTVRVRFRSGTDAGSASLPWDIDNIGFEGITNQPFSSRVADTAQCGSLPPDPDAGTNNNATPTPEDTIEGGACGCTTPGTRTDTPLLALALAGLLLRRRARG
jgi:large repetitive protein